MVFRSLLLCALVSYVAVIAASPIEGSLPESKEVEVENVESTTQDINLIELEDISIEGEVVNQDSEEHPESAAGFRKGVSNALGSLKKLPGKIGKAGRSTWNKARHIPSKAWDKVRGRKPSASSSHSGNHKPAHPHGKPTHKVHGTKTHVKPSRGSSRPATVVVASPPEPSFMKEFGQSALTSLASTFIEGATNKLVDHADEMIGNAVAAKPTQRDYQYANHAEGDGYGSADNGGGASDEDDGEKCKEKAMDHCFEKFKGSEVKKCMKEYKCSRD